MELVAIGTSQFLLGFELAGVEKTVLVTQETVLSKIKENEQIFIDNHTPVDMRKETKDLYVVEYIIKEKQVSYP